MDSTDISIFVKKSEDNFEEWDKRKIINALIIETNIDLETAECISNEVEILIMGLRLKQTPTSLIRELVNAKLIEKGLMEERNMHQRIGIPLYDINSLMLHKNNENANIPHGPEATNLMIAGQIKKEYALNMIYNQKSANAHINGDIHIHDLDFVDRVYCGGQNIEYIKKFGLNLPNAMTIAKPAKHAEVLIAHLIKFSAALQCNFAGAIGWDAVNLFLAPYMVGMSYKELKQLAQILIYEFSQQAVARGGQSIFSDLNIYWEVPNHFVNVEAIGPGGKYTGKKYYEYKNIAQQFVLALFDVYLEGDGSGRPFFFPKPNCHITESLFNEPNYMEYLEKICTVSSIMGNPYYIFDRGNTAKISECCRLSFTLKKSDLELAKEPWRMRYCALQNVTINLPRIALRSGNNLDEFEKILTENINSAVYAHLNKKNFITQLLEQDNSPLELLKMNKDGDPYLKLNNASYLIGMVGLNETVKIISGKEIHESKNTQFLGLNIISMMNKIVNNFKVKYGINLVLEQTPAESTSYRFAKLDIEKYQDAYKYIKGIKNNIYYTNSTHLGLEANITPMERVKIEGKFHPMIEAGAISHIWIGEHEPNPESLIEFVKTTFRKTSNSQITFSPEFTTCNNCFKTSKGLKNQCEYCGSANVDGITRITGYFTKISSWNKGKLGELADRQRINIE